MKAFSLESVWFEGVARTCERVSRGIEGSSACDLARAIQKCIVLIHDGMTE